MNSSSPLPLVNGSLGAITLIGGLTGYVKRGSLASALAGSSIGLLYLYSSYTGAHNDPTFGRQLGMLASAALAGGMIPRGIKSGKAVPIAIGTLGLGAFIVNYLDHGR
jgi:uncharacterized membrane protein (UPF0136 family)